MNHLLRQYANKDETFDYRGFSEIELKQDAVKAAKKLPLTRSVNVARQEKAGIVLSDRKAVSN